MRILALKNKKLSKMRRKEAAALLREYAEWGDKRWVNVPWRTLWEAGFHELGGTGVFAGHWPHHVLYVLFLAELLETE